MRQTSIDAYLDILNSGQLSRMEKQVFEVIATHGPVTGNEICKILNKEGSWKLCSILEHKGVIKIAGSRQCTRTGYEAYVWVPTGNKPVKRALITQQKADEITYKLLEDLEILDSPDADIKALVQFLENKRRAKNDRQTYRYIEESSCL